MLRIILCLCLLVVALSSGLVIRAYRQELHTLVQTYVALRSSPALALHAFCVTPRPESSLVLLQCRQIIATRQQQNVCPVAVRLSYQTRRYYYLELNCYLRSKLLSLALPRLRLVIFA